MPVKKSELLLSPKLGPGLATKKRKPKRGPDDEPYTIFVPDYLRTKRGRKGLDPPTEPVSNHWRREAIC